MLALIQRQLRISLLSILQYCLKLCQHVACVGVAGKDVVYIVGLRLILPVFTLVELFIERLVSVLS